MSTRYDILDSTLIQVVEPDADTLYPIVADPSVSFGRTKLTVTLNPEDQRNLLSATGAGTGALIAALVCSGGGPLAVGCAFGAAFFTTLIAGSISSYAVREGCDLKVTVAYFRSGFVVSPHVTSVRRVCRR